MITELGRIFNVENSEYGYTIEDIEPVKLGECINLYVPKLMGAIDCEAGTYNIITNKLFKNARECRPNIDKRITLLNSIPVEMKSSTGWETKVNENGIVPKGTRFIVEYINGNIQNPIVTTK